MKADHDPYAEDRLLSGRLDLPGREGGAEQQAMCEERRAAYERVTPPTEAEVREELERRKRDMIADAIAEAQTEIVNLSDAENPVAKRLSEVRKLLEAA